MTTCPVCGYLMLYPASDFHICPCCGTEFGYDDAGRRYAELRTEWLRAGAVWWSPVDVPPDGWDPFLQLDNLIEHRSVWEALFNSPNPGNVVSGELAAMFSGKDQPYGKGITGTGLGSQPVGQAS